MCTGIQVVLHEMGGGSGRIPRNPQVSLAWCLQKWKQRLFKQGGQGSRVPGVYHAMCVSTVTYRDTHKTNMLNHLWSICCPSGDPPVCMMHARPPRKNLVSVLAWKYLGRENSVRYRILDRLFLPSSALQDVNLLFQPCAFYPFSLLSLRICSLCFFFSFFLLSVLATCVVFFSFLFFL